MSYFSDILSSVSGRSVQTPPAQSSPAPVGASKSRPNGLAAGMSPGGGARTDPAKRKVEHDAKEPSAKSARLGASLPPTVTKPSHAPRAPGRPNISKFPDSPPKPELPGTSSSTAATSSMSPVRGTAPPTCGGPLPPKPGSYREIMARAQAAKDAQATLGQIKHKSVEKLSKRERERQAAIAAQKQKSAAVRDRLHLSNGKRQIPHSGSTSTCAKGNQTLKPKKERAPLQYQGTMRGIVKPATASRGSANTPENITKKSKQSKYSEDDDNEDGYGKRYVYAGSSEDEMESDDDEGSDSMEGGGFDELEAEEQASLAAARREDAKALREENEHRRMKEERKKKLALLAAKAGKPKY